MQVLIVDDEIAIVELLADLLSFEGYEVTRAHNGKVALGMLRAGLRPEVVVTDVMMAELDGLGLYHAIRSELSDEPIGVLLMSAGKEIHIDDPHAAFIAKPFSIPDLLDAIERLA